MLCLQTDRIENVNKHDNKKISKIEYEKECFAKSHREDRERIEKQSRKREYEEEFNVKSMKRFGERLGKKGNEK